MRILVACEYSGTVSAAFAAKGHDVTSCDIIPSDYPHGSNLPSFKHHIGDVLELISKENFDLMVGHPPCTYLCLARLWDKSLDRIEKRKHAADFVRRLYESNIKHIALENPIGWLNRNWMAPHQITSAHRFGSPYKKDICLWLKNLPPLIEGCVSSGKKRVANHTNSRMSQAIKSKIKSKFFPEVAEAMANQWTEKYLMQEVQ